MQSFRITVLTKDGLEQTIAVIAKSACDAVISILDSVAFGSKVKVSPVRARVRIWDEA